MTIIDDMAKEILGELEAARASAMGGLFSNMCDAIEDGFPWDGEIYQIDDVSTSRMVTVLGELRSGATDAHGGFWITSSNLKVDMDSSEVTSLLEGAISFRLDIDQRYLTQRDKLSMATTVDEISEIGIDF